MQSNIAGCNSCDCSQLNTSNSSNNNHNNTKVQCNLQISQTYCGLAFIFLWPLKLGKNSGKAQCKSRCVRRHDWWGCNKTKRQRCGNICLMDIKDIVRTQLKRNAWKWKWKCSRFASMITKKVWRKMLPTGNWKCGEEEERELIMLPPNDEEITIKRIKAKRLAKPAPCLPP